jgi:hypothetical protein
MALRGSAVGLCPHSGLWQGNAGIRCVVSALILSLGSVASAQEPAAAGKQAAVTPSPASPATPPAGDRPPPQARPTIPSSGPVAPPSASPLNPVPAEFPAPRAGGGSAELDRLLSQVASLRSRVAALTTALFSSKMKLELLSSGDGVRVKALRIWVDGGTVYTAPPNASFELPSVVYEHAMAPGPHVVGVEIERYGVDNQQFSSWQFSKFVVLVPEKRTLWAQIELEDESSMAEDFPKDEEGEYDLRVRLQADVSE